MFYRMKKLDFVTSMFYRMKKLTDIKIIMFFFSRISITFSTYFMKILIKVDSFTLQIDLYGFSPFALGKGQRPTPPARRPLQTLCFLFFLFMTSAR